MGNFSNLLILKAGARQPIFSVDLYQSDGITPLDLSLATGALFRMRTESGASLTIANVAATLSGTLQNHLEYLWGPLDTVTPERYVAEAQIVFAIGSPLIVPLIGYWHIIIAPVLP